MNKQQRNLQSSKALYINAANYENFAFSDHSNQIEEAIDYQSYMERFNKIKKNEQKKYKPIDTLNTGGDYYPMSQVGIDQIEEQQQDGLFNEQIKDFVDNPFMQRKTQLVAESKKNGKAERYLWIMDSKEVNDYAERQEQEEMNKKLEHFIRVKAGVTSLSRDKYEMQ